MSHFWDAVLWTNSQTDGRTKPNLQDSSAGGGAQVIKAFSEKCKKYLELWKS